ncbi:hypothetical protein AB4114_27065 [Paenibacillus sp. 2RAB27]
MTIYFIVATRWWGWEASWKMAIRAHFAAVSVFFIVTAQVDGDSGT